MPETFHIVDFEDRHISGFRQVNLAWIEELFWVEEEDARQLDNPRGIVDAGGEILVALVGEEVVGSCALVRHRETEFELAKFAVAGEHRQSGIGGALLRSAIDRARKRGMQRITLVTNSKLVAARKLFERFGFAEVPLTESPYEAANVAMVLGLID